MNLYLHNAKSSYLALDHIPSLRAALIQWLVDADIKVPSPFALTWINYEEPSRLQSSLRDQLRPLFLLRCSLTFPMINPTCIPASQLLLKALPSKLSVQKSPSQNLSSGKHDWRHPPCDLSWSSKQPCVHSWRWLQDSQDHKRKLQILWRKWVQNLHNLFSVIWFWSNISAIKISVNGLCVCVWVCVCVYVLSCVQLFVTP